MIRSWLQSPWAITILSVFFVLAGLIRIFPFDADPNWQLDIVTTASAVIRAAFGFFILPFLTVRYVFRESPRQFGWRFPESFRDAFKWGAILFVGVVPFLFLLSNNSSFRDYYPIAQSFWWAWIVGPFFWLVFYLAEEFLFRGFLVFGLFRRIGYHSVWLSSAIFAFFHITKPLPEMWLSFVLGIGLALLALKTKSFLPAAGVHFAALVVSNLLMAVRV